MARSVKLIASLQSFPRIAVCTLGLHLHYLKLILNTGESCQCQKLPTNKIHQATLSNATGPRERTVVVDPTPELSTKAVFRGSIQTFQMMIGAGS